MPDLVTYLLLRVDAGVVPKVQEAFGTKARTAPALRVRAQDDDRAVVTAEFPLAVDATRTALDLLPTLTSIDPGVRVVVHTSSPSERLRTAPSSDPPSAVALLDQARPQQVLVSAAAAVLIGPTLPLNLELVEVQPRGPDGETGPRNRAERTYKVRPASDDPQTSRPASNLAWARRAAGSDLVGRAEVASSLSAAWQSTLRGAGRTVVLVGESGIGKTATAADLALRAHAEGALTLYGRWDREHVSSYRAFREALGTYLQRLTASTRRHDPVNEHTAAIGPLLADLEGRRYVSRPANIDGEGERLRVYEAVEGLLDHLAAEQPVLLVLDDLHWAERSSRLLVDHLLHAAGTEPWMLLMTAREPRDLLTGQPVAAQGTNGTNGSGGPDYVHLRGLDAPSVSLLVGQTLGRVLEPHHEAVERLTAETAGNPLFVRQALCGLRDVDDLGAALLAADRPLSDAVRWRLDQLPLRTREVLSRAAVVGSSPDLDVIGAAAAMAPVAVRTALRPALDEDLLHLDATGERYGFGHEVVRRTLRDEIAPELAALIHRRVAGALEARAADVAGAVDPTEIAHHHLLGADPETAPAAVLWARRAAVAAQAATGFDEAARLLGQAIAVHDRFVRGDGRTEDETVACELRLEAADAQDLASHFEARDELFARAAALARDSDDTVLFVRAALGYGGRLPAAPPPSPSGRRLLEEALGRLGDHDVRERALVLARLAHLRHFDGPYEERRQLADEAVALARQLDDPATLGTALVGRSLALEGPGRVDDRLASGAEVARIGERLKDTDLRLQGIRIQLPALLTLGRCREARQLAANYAEQANKIHHQDHQRLAALWDIVWATLEGDHAGAEALTRRLADELIRWGHTQGLVIQFAYTFVPRWLHGEIEQSRPTLDALRVAEPDRAVWWAVSAWLEVGTGRQDRARQLLDERDPVDFLTGLEPDFMWWPAVEGCTVAAALSGHRRWAEALTDVLGPHAGTIAVTGLGICGGAVDHHLGTLALVLDRLDAAVELLEAGLTSHRAFGAVPYVGLSARWLSHALAVRDGPGDRDRAATLRAELDVLAERIGLRGIPRFDQPPAPGPATGDDDS